MPVLVDKGKNLEQLIEIISLDKKQRIVVSKRLDTAAKSKELSTCEYILPFQNIAPIGAFSSNSIILKTREFETAD